MSEIWIAASSHNKAAIKKNRAGYGSPHDANVLPKQCSTSVLNYLEAYYATTKTDSKRREIRKYFSPFVEEGSAPARSPNQQQDN